MGWLFVEKQEGVSVKDFFKSQFDHKNGKVLDCKVVNFREGYLAYQCPEGVTAIVCLLEYRPNDSYNFGYKTITEDMGPCYYNCPESILNMLTEPPNEYAEKWRNECRRVSEIKKERRKMSKRLKQKYGTDGAALLHLLMGAHDG